MYGEGTPDRLVDALRALLVGRANAAISWTDSEGNTLPAVRTSQGHPVVRSNLHHEQHPLLSVVRKSSKHFFQGKRRMRQSTIVVEWYAPRCARDHTEDFWTSMQAVAEAMIDALDGFLPNSTTNVLEAAGGFDVPEETIAVDYNYVSLPDDTYPFFQLRFDIRHTPNCLPLDETAGLPDLRELLAKYLGRDVPDESQPLVSTLTQTTTGVLRQVASDDPLDDDSEDEEP